MAKLSELNKHHSVGATFHVARAMEIICLICLIGLTSDFVSQMVLADQKPPGAIIGTLVITILATLYVLITYILAFDGLLSYFFTTISDTCLLIALLTISIVAGIPISYLDCPALSTSGGSMGAFVDSLDENVGNSESGYWVWDGASQKTCFETKAIWGLMIALCVLFAFSAVMGALIWRMEGVLKSAGNENKGVEKDVEDGQGGGWEGGD